MTSPCDGCGGLQFSDVTFQGVLVVFCGLDGSGKSTLIKLLADEAMRLGVEPLLTKQPTDAVRTSPLFQRVMYSPNFESEIEYRSHSLITVSDRVQHSLRVILPALREGSLVISDRYFFSAVANLRARGYLNDKWIYEIGNMLPKPDAAIFCEPPFSLIEQRLSSREEERGRYFDRQFNRRLYEEFNRLQSRYPGALTIDTSSPPLVTYSRLRSRLAPLLLEKLGIQLGDSVA